MPNVPAVLAASEPIAHELYGELIKFARRCGEFTVEEKKASLHLVRKSAFAGVHPRKKHLVLTIKAAGPIKNNRVFRSEQVSNSRWHHEVKLSDKSDFDAELLGWLEAAYSISA